MKTSVIPGPPSYSLVESAYLRRVYSAVINDHLHTVIKTPWGTTEYFVFNLVDDKRLYQTWPEV